MGHGSPLVQQARRGQRPDSVCLVVGSCAQGFPPNLTGDLMVSLTPLQNQCQYFWEAFPAREGRTTYLFTYVDVDPARPSLEQLFAEYLRLLPAYQGIELAQVQFKRALYGFFPCYQQSPLQLPWNRMLPVGDSSGSQSPLSFGGFGAMVRHLGRLSTGIDQALRQECLQRDHLALLQPYQPSLSVTWLFQRAMSARVEQSLAPDQINQLLGAVFQSMAQFGGSGVAPLPSGCGAVSRPFPVVADHSPSPSRTGCQSPSPGRGSSFTQLDGSLYQSGNLHPPIPADSSTDSVDQFPQWQPAIRLAASPRSLELRQWSRYSSNMADSPAAQHGY